MNGTSKSWAVVEEMALTGLLGPVLSNVRTRQVIESDRKKYVVALLNIHRKKDMAGD